MAPQESPSTTSSRSRSTLLPFYMHGSFEHFVFQSDGVGEGERCAFTQQVPKHHSICSVRGRGPPGLPCVRNGPSGLVPDRLHLPHQRCAASACGLWTGHKRKSLTDRSILHTRSTCRKARVRVHEQLRHEVLPSGVYWAHHRWRSSTGTRTGRIRSSPCTAVSSPPRSEDLSPFVRAARYNSPGQVAHRRARPQQCGRHVRLGNPITRRRSA